MDYSQPQKCLDIHYGMVKGCFHACNVLGADLHLCTELEGHQGKHRCECGAVWEPEDNLSKTS